MKSFAGLLVLVTLFGLIYGIPHKHNRQQVAAAQAAAAEAEAESILRPQRQADGGHHHDAVDFGAHTGEHGAFGWYADFPVHGGGH